MLLSRSLALGLCLLAGPVLSHEFWIAPLTYQVAPGESIEAHLRNGERFEGFPLPYLDRRFTRFDMRLEDRETPVPGRQGDVPAVSVAPMGEGLHVFAYRSTVSRVAYKEFAKFASFAEHKDFPDMAARHAARGLPGENFGEAYTRFPKALVAVGHGRGSDGVTGLETEIVARANPYTDDMSGGLPVSLFYRGVPRPEAQIEIFDRAPDGIVTVTTTRTDGDGNVSIPVRPGHSYLLDAVVLREPDPTLAAERDVVWETLWASLTFAVPET